MRRPTAVEQRRNVLRPHTMMLLLFLSLSGLLASSAGPYLENCFPPTPSERPVPYQGIDESPPRFSGCPAAPQVMVDAMGIGEPDMQVEWHHAECMCTRPRMRPSSGTPEGQTEP